MSRATRFLIALIGGLALLTFGAELAVNATTREWFERDVELRSRLAVNAVRRELTDALSKADKRALTRVLQDLAHDERILGAAACGANGRLVAATAGLPEGVVCGRFAVNTTQISDAGSEHFTVLPVGDDGQIILVHDLSYLAPREAKTRLFLLIAFAFLALSASLITLVASRLSWRNWNAEMRDALRGVLGTKPQYRPLLQDVHALAQQMAGGDDTGRWTSKRLKETVGSSRVDLQACKLEYSIVSPK